MSPQVRGGVLNNERHDICEYLRSDLYEKVNPSPDPLGLTFVNPGFRVRVSGGRNDPTVEAWRVTGEPLFVIEHATVEAVADQLP